MTLEEALTVAREAQRRYGLKDEQILVPVYDIYHSKDNSRAIQKVREMVWQCPEVLEAMEKRQ